MEVVNDSLDLHSSSATEVTQQSSGVADPISNASSNMSAPHEGTEEVQGTPCKGGDPSVPSSPDVRYTGGTVDVFAPIAAAIAGAKKVGRRASVPQAVRPCFRVYDESVVIEETGRMLGPGVYWHDRLSDKEEDSAKSSTDIFVSGPVYIEAQTADTAGNSFGRLLRFQTTRGNWRQFSMPMHCLRGDGADIRGELLDMGLMINPDQRQRFNRYLQGPPPKRQATCTTMVGWTNKAFVFPDEVIGDSSAEVVFQTDGRIGDECSVGGSLDGWRTNIARLAVGNPLMLISLCAAFAGPLLRDCHAENGGVHVVGNSSAGKSTLLKISVSVWGDRNYRRSWLATANGLEGAAALHNDALLALDEISEADPKDVGAIVYMLSNGAGKSRASRTGGSRPVTRWRVMLLSTGELSIASTMEEGGARQKAGQAVRLLDLPANRAYGVFDDLHEFSSGALLSNHLQSASEADFGHPARAFVTEMLKDSVDHAGALAELRESGHFNLPRMDQQEALATSTGVQTCALFALLAYAGELATRYGITGWETGTALRAATNEFSKWRQLRGAGRAEHIQIIQALVDFVDRHCDGRFSSVDSDYVIRERAGWYIDGDDGRTYLFNSTALREALCGFDLKPALDVLEKLGVVPKAKPDGKRVSSKRIRGDVVKVYEVHAGRLRAATE